MKACKIKHLQVRCAQIKASCAILISPPLAYAFYTFCKYTATYSSVLQTGSSFSIDTGPAPAGKQFLGLGVCPIFKTSASSPTAWKVYGRLSQADAGMARVVLWILFREVGFIPGYTTEALV